MFFKRVKQAARAMRDGAGMDRELDAEVQFHIEMETQKHIRQGRSPDEARRLAARNFGPMEKHKEEARDARGVSWLEEFLADLRYGARTLRKNPGFAALAVLTLGLGIGANTAIFSVINGVLLKPLPYENGDRLVLVQQSAPLNNQANFGVSIKELYDYRAQLASFEGLVEFHQMSFDLLRRGEPDRVATGVVSPNFFDVLGVKPLIGRTFVPTDDDHGAEAVLVLGHAYWRTKFGADPDIVGQVFEMNDRPHTVVGVLPPVPHYPNEVDVYMPTEACPFRSAAEQNIEANRRAFAALNVFGLLKPDASPETAATEVATIAQRWAQDFPQVYRPALGFQARTANVLDELTSGARELLLILLGTTGLVLLLACANVANLTLARMLRRDRELAMRTALGAGRGRLVRQLLTESTVLSVAGGIVGFAFAWMTVDMLTTFVGRFTARTGEIALDAGVMGFTLLVSIVTGLVFGTFPALASRVDLVSALKAGGKGTSNAGSGRKLQRALIVAQVAVSVVLLVGAGLLLLSFYRLQNVDPGYRGESVMSAEVFGNFTTYPNGESVRRLYVSLLDRLESTPGVMSAALTNAVPMDAIQPGQLRFQIRGRTYASPDEQPATDLRIASPGYFATLGVPLVRGRFLTDLDHEDAPSTIVINETLARREWEGRDPIGAEVSANNGRTWATVVGVVADVKMFGLDRDPIAQAYMPLRQAGAFQGRVLLRMSGDPAQAAAVIRDAVRSIDPNLPIENMRTLDEVRDSYLATPRLTAVLLTMFAGLALLVTITGITGVIAQSVSQRTQEFGLRMALGASQRSVLGMVLGQGLWLVGLGLVIGIAASFALARVLESYLYQTTPTDPLTLVGVSVAFIVAGALACLGPAWRATTVDPMLALRAD
ncbi:MAG TPA: ABC transporter permease [Vicinamibacterales bacterium]|nr:ABC transporter permease [Vicinamibacterales bacterium]